MAFHLGLYPLQFSIPRVRRELPIKTIDVLVPQNVGQYHIPYLIRRLQTASMSHITCTLFVIRDVWFKNWRLLESNPLL